MELKFYLNKFCKVDNIEHYTLGSLMAIKNKYDEFIENSDGHDPDFPMTNFGGDKGKKIGGTNVHTIGEDDVPTESIVHFDNRGRETKPEKPKANLDDYKDKRSLSAEERALKFLKSKNLQ